MLSLRAGRAYKEEEVTVHNSWSLYWNILYAGIVNSTFCTFQPENGDVGEMLTECSALNQYLERSSRGYFEEKGIHLPVTG